MKKLILSCLFATAVLSTACNYKESQNNTLTAVNSEETIIIEHQLGSTEVVKNPQKVVLLNFGIADSFDKLGIKIAGLPKGSLPSYLNKFAEDKSIADIGNIATPNFEKINELGPDLIIISARQIKLYDELSKIGPTIYMDVDNKNYISSFKSNAEQLGKLFGKEEEIANDLKQIDAKLAEIKKVTENMNKKALIVLANEGRISAYGKGSRFGIIHDVFGIKATTENIEASTHGQAISNEFIKETNPDILFIVDRGAALKKNDLSKEQFSNPLIAQTNAYKNDKIIFLSPDVWYLSGGGLSSMQMMIDEVQKAIQ